MQRKIKLIFCLMLVSLMLVACEKAKYDITIVDNEYGSVICQSTAKSGDEVVIDIDGKYSYDNYEIYLNGVKLNSNKFEMPESNVEIVVSLAANNENAYDVIIVENEMIKTISNLSKANPGDEIVLTSYASFNCTVKGYLINNEMILGNSFTMPEEIVTIETVYENMFDENGVSLKVESYYHFATSYWNAKYTEDGLVVDICVDDDIIFTTSKATNGIGMRDNVEFICGVNGTNNIYSEYIKVLVSADGDYYYQRRSNNNWVTVYDSRISFEHSVCNFNDEGFNGYRVKALVPYSVLNTTYNNALGNLTLLPAMRNTLNVAFTNFGIFDEYGSTWEDHRSHPIVSKDNKIVENIIPVDVLFVGDQLFKNYSDKNVFNNQIGEYKFYAEANRSISYWQENMSLITRYNPKEVIFQVGEFDLLQKSVLKTFESLVDFIDAFHKALPNTKLTIVSAIPVYKTSYDVNKTLAYNAMVYDYVNQFENIDYLDIATHLFVEGNLNSNLYVDYNYFSEMGCRYLTYQLNNYFGISNLENMNAWGSVENYIMFGGWKVEDDKITVDGNGTCRLFSDTLHKSVVVEADFSVKSVLNGDAYPKFGYSLSSNDITQYYYVDASNNLTCPDVSIVNCIKGEYNWSSYSLISVDGLDYNSPEVVNLKLIKVNERIIFLVNNQVIFNVSVSALEGQAALGLFSFNLNYEITNLKVITDESLIIAEVEALN